MVAGTQLRYYASIPVCPNAGTAGCFYHGYEDRYVVHSIGAWTNSDALGTLLRCNDYSSPVEFG